MAKTLKVPASDAFLRDFAELQRRLGTRKDAETVRLAVGRLLAILRELDRSRTVYMEGRNGQGDDVKILMT